jgi:hypothetical protein
MTRTKIREFLIDAEECAVRVAPAFNLAGYFPRGGDGEATPAEIVRSRRGVARARDVINPGATGGYYYGRPPGAGRVRPGEKAREAFKAVAR